MDMMEDEGDWNGTTAARWDTIHVVCGFAASLLFLGTWQNAIVVGFGIVGGILAFSSFFVRSEMVRKVLSGLVGLCLVIVAMSFWITPSFQEDSYYYYDGGSEGFGRFYIPASFGVTYFVWGLACVGACFFLPGSQFYEAYLPQPLQPYIGRLFASFMFFIYGLMSVVEFRGIFFLCFLFITIGAILLGAYCILRDSTLSSVAAVIVSLSLLLLSFEPLITGDAFLWFGYFLPGWAHFTSVFLQAWAYAFWWFIVCLDSSLPGSTSKNYSGGAGEGSEGASGEWPVDFCDCCGDGCSVCLWATFCGCCMHGQTEELFSTGKSGEPCEMHCSGPCWLTWFLGLCQCYWILPCLLRGRIRQRRDIEGNCVGDCLASWCCPCCVGIQDYRTVKNSTGAYREVN